MTADISKVDLLLQYSLLVAGQEDDLFDRQLGPIHLIKYVYLADLLHSERREGATFTGVPWQFYKFGPWSQVVNSRIEPALTAIQATKSIFESDYGDREDWVRWQANNDHKLREIENSIPVFVGPQVKRLVHRFGKDTASLLDFVYCTKPMLRAAPHEYLEFTIEPIEADELGPEMQGRLSSLSNKKRKLFREKMKGLRNSKKATSHRLVNPVKRARFDHVYEEGVEWLDSLAGTGFELGEVNVEFDDEIWKSPTRNIDDIP